jgi:hypothetical protein
MPLVLAMLAAAVALWVHSNFERVTEREFVDFSGEARRNPLLAFERLVQRMGVQAGTETERAALDDLAPGVTLVLGGERRLSPQRVSAITAWLAAGGHVIVEAEIAGERDPLLDALGVTRRPGRRPPSAGDLTLRLPGRSEPLRADLPLIGLEYRGTGESYSTPAGAAQALLHIRHGSGRASVLSSFDFMRNEDIGEYDHAALAWGLVRLMPDTRRVLIARRSEPLSVLEWLVANAQAVLLSGAALLALCLWRAGRRFGPLEAARQPRRRRLLDHLRASGRFQWAAGSAPTLLSAAREACLAKIARTRPALAGLEPSARNTRLAALTRLPAGDIEHAFEGEASTPRAFTAAVGTLQQIEDKLAHTVSA